MGIYSQLASEISVTLPPVSLGAAILSESKATFEVRISKLGLKV